LSSHFTLQALWLTAGQCGDSSYHEVLQAIGEIFSPGRAFSLSGGTTTSFLSLSKVQLPTHPELQSVFEAFLSLSPRGNLFIPLGVLTGWLEAMYPTFHFLLSPSVVQPLLLSSPHSRAACGFMA